MVLGNTIKQGNAAFENDSAKTIIFLHRYLHGGLKFGYFTLKGLVNSFIELEEEV